MNTIQKGSVRCIVFKEDSTWYGVALEFNIVVEGDTPQMATFELDEAIKGYVQSVKVANLRSDHILNQTPAQEYEELWKALEKKEPVPSPYQVHSYGTQLTY